MPVATARRANPLPAEFTGNSLVRTAKHLFHATRPKFFPASVLPVLVGTAWGVQVSGQFDAMAFALALLATVCVHAGSNVINDVGDDSAGTDRQNSVRIYPYTGGSRFIQVGIMDTATMARLGFGLLSLTLAGCGNDRAQLPLLELTGSTMGTSYSVKLVAPAPQTDTEALQAKIDSSLARIEQRMSTYQTNSELSLFNRSESTDWVEVSAELCGVIEQALSVSEITSAFDITVGPLVNLWGFGPTDTRPEPPDAGVITETLRYTGFEMLHTQCTTPAIRKKRADLYLDLSAYAKGYAVDQIVALLSGHGLDNYLVEIGGELRMHGRNAGGKLWSVAIEKPAEFESAVQTIVQLTDAAIATSGDYRNFFLFDGQRYSHTIDPNTGYPVTHNTAAVSVISDTAAFADAMATALLVLGVDEGLALAEREDIAAYFMLRTDSGMQVYSTQAFASITGTQ